MHTLLRVTMTDVAMANEAVKDGRLQKVIEHVSKSISPECTFFYADQGYRTAIMAFDLKDSSLIPQIAEPFFTELNAKVDFFPAMNPTELSRGLESWNKVSSSFASLS